MARGDPIRIQVGPPRRPRFNMLRSSRPAKAPPRGSGNVRLTRRGGHDGGSAYSINYPRARRD